MGGFPRIAWWGEPNTWSRNPLTRLAALGTLSRDAQGCPGKPRGESISRRRMPRKTAVFRLLSGLRDLTVPPTMWRTLATTVSPAFAGAGSCEHTNPRTAVAEL